MPSDAAEPDRIVAIDWSGRADGAGQRRHIWAACWTSSRWQAVFKRGWQDAPSRQKGSAAAATSGEDPDATLGGSVRLEAGRTRDEIAEWLIALARETPRLVVGFDFCFSFPAWFVREELGCRSAPEFWRLVTATHGEHWLARRLATDPAHDPRFWGKPHKRPAEFSGERLHRMLRATDIDCKLSSVIPEAARAARVRGITPKSVFQIGGSGSVGTASLRGMPVLLRLHEAGFRVWPFDAPRLSGSSPQPLVVEMYTRLMTGAVHKSNAEARRGYLARRRRPYARDGSAHAEFDPRYCELSRAVLAHALAGEDAFDALVSCMVMARRRAAFASLPQPQDPDAGIEGWTWAPEVAETC